MKNAYINDIAEALANGHATLMVGAGFSKNAQQLSATDKRFLNWNEMSDLFYDHIYGDTKGPGKEYYSSLRLAQEVEVISGRPRLENILKEAVPDMDYAPTELFTHLMELPWKDVFTTNYDTLLERAAETVTSRRYNVVVSQEDLVNSNDAPRIIKLHGSFPAHRPFIITEEDYRTYPVRFAALVNTVQQALLENVFCMIGFSCEDPNFLSWIGWIHDNLGKSSSQKIYMISVAPVSEAKSKLLFEQNIIVVNLMDIWQNEDFSGRISAFIDELQKRVEKNEEKDSWFNVNKLPCDWEHSLEARTKVLYVLNNSYPGWIFLPWKMKSRVSYVLQTLEHDEVLSQRTIQECLPYMCEYVKFLDIVGRPMLSNVTMKFWEMLCNSSGEMENVDGKIQMIYLQLLRAFREQAQWDNYDKCRSKIIESKLSYDDRQFLYACDWWQLLYRFAEDNLTEKLDDWVLSKGDLYWPLTKSSMYAIVGECTKAENILMENLVLLRQRLARTEKKEYLSSIEESYVSLINFIRQRNFSLENMETCTYQSQFSWWEENDKYCLVLNSKDRNETYIEKVNFDLSRTYTSHFGKDNTNIFYAMEYMRFIEQSGHHFRLGNVTNTKGLEGTLTRVVPYYPHWCLVQTLLAQDTKHIDLFYGRAQLANMTQTEVDEITVEYVRILRVLSKNVKPQNYFCPTSIYEQAAVVFPQLLARLVYKCSVETLDLVLDSILEICGSDVRSNFKGIRKLLQGLIQAYSKLEQSQRISKILLFPMQNDRINDYIDPINYVWIPERKVILTSEVYAKVISEIRSTMASDDLDGKQCAKDRLISLYQIVELNKEDVKYLFQILDKNNSRNSEVLYYLKTEDKKQYAQKVFEDAVERLNDDAKQMGTFSGGVDFRSAISAIKDLDIEMIDYKQVFKVIKAFVDKNYSWALNRNNFEADERIRIGLLMFFRLYIMKKDVGFSVEEKENAMSIVKVVENFYHSPVVTLFAADCLGIESSNNILSKCNQELWLSEKKDIGLLKDYYNELRFSGKDLSQFSNSNKFWDYAIQFSVCRMFNTENNLLEILQLCHSLLMIRISEGRK